MPQYQAPVTDTRFVLEHIVGLERQANVPGFANATPELVQAILEEGGRLASDVIFPLNQVGDHAQLSSSCPTHRPISALRGARRKVRQPATPIST